VAVIKSVSCGIRVFRMILSRIQFLYEICILGDGSFLFMINSMECQDCCLSRNLLVFVLFFRT
jgi:hypothetical protein